MSDSTKAGLREEIARTLIARRFGLGGLLMFDIPGEATPDQRAHLEARARQALAEADAVIAGPLAPLLDAALIMGLLIGAFIVHASLGLRRGGERQNRSVLALGIDR